MENNEIQDRKIYSKVSETKRSEKERGSRDHARIILAD
jgi:hypothetical protein